MPLSYPKVVRQDDLDPCQWVEVQVDDRLIVRAIPVVDGKIYLSRFWRIDRDGHRRKIPKERLSGPTYDKVVDLAQGVFRPVRNPRHWTEERDDDEMRILPAPPQTAAPAPDPSSHEEAPAQQLDLFEQKPR